MMFSEGIEREVNTARHSAAVIETINVDFIVGVIVESGSCFPVQGTMAMEMETSSSMFVHQSDTPGNSS
jgi:hypothetical protein